MLAITAEAEPDLMAGTGLDAGTALAVRFRIDRVDEKHDARVLMRQYYTRKVALTLTLTLTLILILIQAYQPRPCA